MPNADRPTTAETILEAQQLEKRVVNGSVSLTILQDIQLQIPAGAAVAIVGASGSGKSTLLGLLAGLDLPTQGRVRLLGQALETLDEDQRAALRAGQVGFVFQSFQLLPGLTALENVCVPLELIHYAGDIPQQATETLTQLGLAERLHHLPAQLSGGEQQRVALARAFVTRPRILFADEPTGNLDQATGAQIVQQMFSLQREQAATLVLVTHDPALAARCDLVLKLEAGRLQA